MSSPVRVGTYAPITSKITPVLFLPVRGIVQNLHVCLSPPPTNTADQHRRRNGTPCGTRKRGTREKHPNELQRTWRVLGGTANARELSLISADVSTWGLGGLGLAGIDREFEEKKERKIVEMCVLEIAKYCRLVEEDWRSFSYFVSIGRRGMIPSDLWSKISLFWRRGWNEKFGKWRLFMKEFILFRLKV